MKKILYGILILIIIIASCGESEEERLAREQKEEEARLLKEQQEKETALQVEKAKEKVMDKVNAAIESCDSIEEYEDLSFCYPEAAVEIAEKFGAGIERDITIEKPVLKGDISKKLCNQAIDTGLCYHYTAYVLGIPGLCKYTDDQIGCSILSFPESCRALFSNKADCYEIVAELMIFVDLDGAKSICEETSKSYGTICQDIDFEDEMYQSESFREGFMKMQIVSLISDLQLGK